MSVDDYLNYSLDRLRKEKWHIVVLENIWYWIDILNYQCKDTLLNYFILWERWMKYTVWDIKKILFYKDFIL